MKKRYQSFANRLTRKVMLTVLATMIVIGSIIFGITFKAINAEADGRYEAIMNIVSEKLGKILAKEEIGVRNLSDELWNSLDSPEMVMKALEKMIKLNNYSHGYFVAFEPGYFPEYEKWVEIYINKEKDEHPRNIGSASHDYLSKDWYIRTKEIEEGSIWSDPYYDDVGMCDNVCSFTMPLYDKKDSVVGVCGTDIPLKWLVNELQVINDSSYHYGVLPIDLGEDTHFYTLIFSSDGTYIAHPQERRVLRENVAFSIDQSNEADRRIIQDMMQMKRGKASMTFDGVWSNVYYAPLESAKWAMAIVVPKKATWLPALLMSGLLLLLTDIGLVVIYYFCRSTIRQVASPLGALAKSTEEVAKGNFDAPLPVIEYQDEVCELRDSFAAMQESLVKYIEDTKEKAVQEAALLHDLDVAHNIQMSMIPTNILPNQERKDIDIHGFLTPARSIGGDLYDFFIHDDKLFFCIGDVSGKGISAALVMSAMHFMFRIVSHKEDNPKHIIETMNNLYASENESLIFSTFFLGILDLKTHLLQYCNAGHELPILITDEVHVVPVKANLALGLFKDKVYCSEEIQLSPGSVFLLYTDGLKEAINKDEECFGMERIQASLQHIVDKGPANASDYVRRLVDDVENYMGDTPQADDLTLLAVKIKE
jgi:sigma-B regulation protein RsbU (phosphoserine phosphatase)